MIDWALYPNFAASEFDCRHTGKNFMGSVFMRALQELRYKYYRPRVSTSVYRDITHPVEACKQVPGYHNKGVAADIACTSDQAYALIKLAIKHGFTGIGVCQNGKRDRFIHLDMRETTPVVYSY